MNNDEALKKLQLTELDILEKISSLCDEYDIAWFIDAGTLLGAARHQGFIPWDDDVDIAMLRPDYDRFIEVARDHLPCGYSLHTFDDTPGFAGMFAKVYRDGTVFATKETQEAGCDQSIFVDIFPYDFLEADALSEARQRRTAKFWQSASYLWHSGTIVVPHKGILGRLEKMGCRVAHRVIKALVKRDWIKNRFDTAVIRHKLHNDDIVLELAWPNIQGYRVRDLLPVSLLPFEGVEFPAPHDWESYLTQMYGDWRKLPALEDRRTHLPLELRFVDGSRWSSAQS